MPSVDGFIKSTPSGSRITASFVIEGINYSFSGSLGSAMQPWTSQNATLHCDHSQDLSSIREFDGRIGPDIINVTLSNGPRLTGTLDTPVTPGSSIAGSGVWTQN